MKIYKTSQENHESYFIATGGLSGTLQNGHSIERLNGEWTIKHSRYYVRDLPKMPVVGEINLGELKELVINAVLNRVERSEDE